MLPNRLPRPLLRTLLALLLTFASAPAFAQSVEAPNLPANLRQLIPRGWVATSYAEVDMNKDGNMDRAVLLAPDSGDEPALGTIRGTPLRDRCRNLLLLVGQPNGLPAVVNFIPWSQLPESLGSTMPKDTCLGLEPVPDFSAAAGPISFSDSLKTVRNTLRYPWEATDWPGESGGTLVIRIEGNCLRLIGEERTESNHGAAWQSSDESSTNYLTRESISSSSLLERCGGDDCEDKEETTGPVTRKIEQRAPICLNDRPLLLSSAAPAPQQPSIPVPAPKQPPQATAPTPPQSHAITKRRPTATADNPYLPPNPLLPRTECLTPPMPMLEHYNRRDSGFGEQLMGSCDGEYDADVCTGVAHTMTFGDILRYGIGDVEYEDTIIWAVDDCGLWFRDANYIPDPPNEWSPQEARRGRYYVAPRQPDGSYFLEGWDHVGKGFRFTQLSGNFLKVRFER
jgi:hypothetical protein